jgi:predicted transcriptional regulator
MHDPAFAPKLREHMRRLGASVSDMAVILDVSERAIYRWLEGYSPRPLTRQAVLFRLDQQKDYRYNAKEIEAALKAFRRSPNR